MFNLVRPVVDYQGTLYIIKRTIKEANIPEENVQEYKKFLLLVSMRILIMI